MNRLIIDAATDRLINVLDEEGKILFDKWFVDGYDKFIDGYCAVEVEEGKWNYINDKGEFLLDEGVDDAEQFENGYGEIMKSGKINFVDASGEIVFKDERFDTAFYGMDGEYIVIYKGRDDNDMYNVFNQKEKAFVFDDWYAYIRVWNHKAYCIKRSDGCWNIADSNGKFLFSEWFDDISSFTECGWAVVKKGDKYNYLNEKGKFLFPEHWFDFCWQFTKKFNTCIVKEGNNNYVFDQYGHLISKRVYGPKGEMIATYDYGSIGNVIEKHTFEWKDNIESPTTTAKSSMTICTLLHKINSWFKTKFKNYIDKLIKEEINEIVDDTLQKNS